MKNNKIMSPFFKINSSNELIYLNSYKLCDLSLSSSVNDYILEAEGVVFPDIKKVKKPNTALILEPHSDDFALSALAYTLNNCNSLVLNVFSKTSLDFFTWKDLIDINAFEYEKLRLSESSFAIEKLLKERFKSLRYQSMRITKDKIQDVKKNICDAIISALKKDKTIDRILVPMGVGLHPDHKIVFDAIFDNSFLFSNYKIILYPEYPYSRCKKAYNDRLSYIKNLFCIKPIIVDTSNNLETIVDVISVFRSQFDDINRSQMLAIVREDYRAIASEYNVDNLCCVYYEIGGVLNEN